MGKASLLSLVADVCNTMGLTALTSVIGNTDQQIIQMLALSNREGKFAHELGAKAGGWTEIGKTFTITLVSSQSTYVMPSDYSFMKPQTVWDQNFRWQLLGPLSPQERDVILYGISPVGPRRRWWIEDGLFNVNPVPGIGDAGTVLSFDYISSNWCQSSGGAGQTGWAADTDNYLLDDEAMRLGILWRYKHAKGLDYGEDKEAWMAQLNKAIARSGGNRYLPINSTAGGIRLISDANVPDTGYGS